jgi:uncharacterized cupin superfamily protein
MSDQKPARPVINLDEVAIEERPAMFQPKGSAAERFSSRMGPIGGRIGARLLGYNITVVPPGKRAVPLHNHHANEEMFFILQGSGELRVGEERWSIRQGDFIASPPGGPEVAHQIVNTGSEEMRYLAVSTMITPETVEYPDSGKVALLSRQTAPDGSSRIVRHIGRPETSIDYWDGE